MTVVDATQCPSICNQGGKPIRTGDQSNLIGILLLFPSAYDDSRYYTEVQFLCNQGGKPALEAAYSTKR